MNSVEYKADGVVYETEDMTPQKSKGRILNVTAQSANLTKSQTGKRNLITISPKIYVNDGSNGTNLINTYSYKNYCTVNEKPSIENHYSNNYKRTLTSNVDYNTVDGTKLHPTGESGGYSNFTTPQFIK